MGRLSIAGHVALITGASSGIGKATAVELARRGASVALMARRRERLTDVAKTIENMKARALVVPGDVSDPEQTAAVVAQTRQTLGPIDILVNNAGYGDPTPFVELGAPAVAQMMRVNFDGAVDLTHQVLPGMIERKTGAVVFVSSVLGYVAMPSMAGYCATKFALRGFAESLAGEVAGKGVHVALVNPGSIQTEFFQQEQWEGVRTGRKPTSPETVARAIARSIERRRAVRFVPWYLGLGATLLPALGPIGRGLMRRLAYQKD